MAAHPYAKRTVRGKTVLLHRYVWELAHGPIPAGMIVHHKDGDKRNNDLSNLELMTPAQHAEHHNQKHARVKTCEVCGSSYEPQPTKRARSRACSYEHARVLMSQAARAREPKYAPELVEEVLRRISAGEQQKAVALDLGVPVTTVSNWVHGRSRAS